MAAKTGVVLLLVGGLPPCLADASADDIALEQALESDVEVLRQEVQELRELVEARRLSGTTFVDNATVASTLAAFEASITSASASAAATETALAAGDQELAVAADSAWLLLCGTLVMFMHAGFAMLETGCCRAKNASNVLMKNLVNVCVGTVGWYFLGWGFAYGGPANADGKLDNKFIGTKEFAAGDFLSNDRWGNIVPYEEPSQTKMLSWFFQWAFCTAAATIVSGGVAERVKSPTYAMYSLVMTSFIYPVVVAWTWGYGWLSEAAGIGYMDFAGSGIVHLTGGVSALAGTIVLGPRAGRFDSPEEFEPHNLPLVVLGTLSLWFGWYGFNCGSTLGMGDASTGALGAQVAMNTTLSAATGGLTVFVLRYLLSAKYDVGGFCNGILAGLVSITAPCGNVESGSAIFIGFVGSVIYEASSRLQRKLGIDDPVDASSVHGAAGIWGVLAAGLFDWGSGMKHYHGWSGWSCMRDDAGDCIEDGIGWWALVAQCYLIGAVVVWAGTLSGLTFFALKMTGHLRIDQEIEEKGMDANLHSPSKAYTIDVYRESEVAEQGELAASI